VVIKMYHFRSVPGTSESMSYVVNLKGTKSSVSQSTFRIGMAPEDIIEGPRFKYLAD
jgi:hypothetical protein